MRGIGEPIQPGRSGDELVECQVHEALLNRAFDGVARDFWLLCPYDTSALAPEIVATARQHHPYVVNGDGACVHGAFDGHTCVDSVLGLPLSPVPTGATARLRRRGPLRGTPARRRVRRARRARTRATGDFVLGVHEVAANSVRHGPGHGVLSLWAEPDRLMAQVEDAGRFADPLVGRVEPDLAACSGRGLWLANQLFDLVQIRSFASGAVVRMHFVIR